MAGPFLCLEAAHTVAPAFHVITDAVGRPHAATAGVLRPTPTAADSAGVEVWATPIGDATDAWLPAGEHCTAQLEALAILQAVER